MARSAVIERISELLDCGGLETSNTSMRIPAALRDAAALAVRELGVGAAVQSAAAGQIAVITSDPGDMRRVAGGKRMTVVAI